MEIPNIEGKYIYSITIVGVGTVFSSKGDILRIENIENGHTQISYIQTIINEEGRRITTEYRDKYLISITYYTDNNI